MSILAGLGIVMFLEQLDDTIKTPEDVERRLNAHFLGAVPYIQVENDDPAVRCTMVHQDAKSPTSESFRSIRTAIHFGIQRVSGDKPRSSWVFMLTSASQAEGKTTAIINLGITLAHSGSRVLLVDADLRRPTIHQRLGLFNEFGLTNYLIGAVEAEGVRQATSIRNLSVVTSGPHPPNPYELLASPRMEAFLLAARRSFDFILLDTPPLLPVSDATLLSGRVDGTILLASAGKTRRVEAIRGRDLLLGRENLFLGVILNFTTQTRDSYYYYYYRALNKYYYRYEPSEPARPPEASDRNESLASSGTRVKS